MIPEQKFVKDWKLEEIVPALDQIKSGRSFEAGRAAFEKTGCAQCHRFDGAGGLVGPDLSRVGERLSARELLESILLPSKMITEGYATTEIETSSDEIITGLVEREDDRTVILRVPGTDQPYAVAKKDIQRRRLSSLSNMPSGIASTLTEPQLLDLLAYLVANGDSSHSSFAASDP